jgi:type I restriction enzyme S subunit
VSDQGHLPKGWAFATIGDLVTQNGLFCDGDWIESKDQDPNGQVRLTQLADIGDGIFLDKSNRFLTTESATRLKCTYLQSGDVLIARMPDPLGRACIFLGDIKPCVTAVDVCVVRPGTLEVSSRWLMWFVNSPYFRNQITSLQSGSTRKRISRRNLATLKLPVPPSAEQRRIVAKIEELFSLLEAGVGALERVRANLKRYRASVLKAAVEGRLTEEWRAEHPDTESASVLLDRILSERRRQWEEDQLAKFVAKGKKPPTGWQAKYKPPPPPDTSDLPELPEGWTWASVGQVGEAVTGTTPATKNPAYYGGTIPFYKPSDLNAGYCLHTAENTITKEGASVCRLLPPMSVLVTCIGATIGKTGLARVEGATNQQINALLPVVKYLKPEWLYWVFTSPWGQRQVIYNASSTTLPILNKSRFEVLPIPLPPLAEQAEIVAEIEQRLSVIDAIEDEVEAGLQRAARLRQAILKRAFEGRLVPQDPSDEPASVLLERIRAERAARVAPRPARPRPAKRGDQKR